MSQSRFSDMMIRDYRKHVSNAEGLEVRLRSEANDKMSRPQNCRGRQKQGTSEKLPQPRETKGT